MPIICCCKEKSVFATIGYTLLLLPEVVGCSDELDYSSRFPVALLPLKRDAKLF